MIPVPSRYPPGVVLVITGELTRYAKFMQDLHALKVPMGSGVLWMASPLVKKNVDTGFQRFLETPNMSWVWLIGDDHSFPRDIVLNLLAREKDCVVPLCLNRIPPISTTLVRHDSGGSITLGADCEGLYKLHPRETCGDAGMLIQREAVLKSGPPWQDEPYCGTWNVEDQRFVRKLQEKGVEVHYDFGNPIDHITPMVLRPVFENGNWQVHILSGGRRVV